MHNCLRSAPTQLRGLSYCLQRCSSSIQAYSEAINRKAPEDGPVSRKVALTDREVVSSQREPAVRASAGGSDTNSSSSSTTTTTTSPASPSVPTGGNGGSPDGSGGSNPGSDGTTTPKTPPVAKIQVPVASGMCSDIVLSAKGSTSNASGDTTLTYLWKNKGRASLNLQNFLLTANEEEITIPRDVVYAAANEYISRNLGISSIDLQFSVTVTDVNGETATASGTLKLSLTLEPPTLTLKSKDNFSIHKGQSIDLSVTADYCPLVATAFDSGVLIQWTASCADDSRTADQLLSLSSDQTTATVRPYTLTPGYKYIVSVTFRYSANASLSDTKSFTINVGTDQVKIRFQFAPYPEATS